MKRTIVVLALITLGIVVNAQTLSWPKTTNTTRPWTRWWWEGSAVNKADLTYNLELYRKAGLGGVEITPIYGIHGAEAQFIPFLTPKWMQMLQHTLNESKRLDMGVDLANATGWPFGGPWVTDADAAKTIYFKTWTLKTGESLKEPVEYIREALIRTANGKQVAVDTLLQPVSANKNLQDLALDQIQYPGKLPLQSLMAYSDKGKTMDLTRFTDANGNLKWTAPDGNWTLYALFQGLHGKMVERAAPGGEGYAIDHFSLQAAQHYFKPFDKAFAGYDLSYLRGFFNDSYEVDDARGQSNWTPDFFAQFQRRKGYDLRKYLPALFGKADAEQNSRVIYDYRSVIDELILENFTHTWKNWAAGKKKMVRNQSHGSPANTLDLYSVVDIPETEGTDILRFKFASSAGHVTGKKLVASESATWLNEHFMSSLGDVKKAIDLYFLGGVNHIVYHGTAYSPKDVAWPGWLFYAAVHFQPTNPQWKDFHALNTYITRVQSFLQQGKPDNDILLYYPITDRYAQPGNALLQHFDGMEKNFEKTDFEHAARWMQEQGYGFDFFSDRQLQQFSMTGKKIATGGVSYKAILLPANKLMEENSFRKLVELARAGATILIYKDLPADVPGMRLLAKRKVIFNQLISQLNFTEEGAIRKATIGAGQFIISDALENLMDEIHQYAVLPGDPDLSVVRRTINNAPVYFIVNRTEKPVARFVSLPGMAPSVGIYDPMTGKTGLARTQTGDNAVMAWIELAPWESVILKKFMSPVKADAFAYHGTANEATALNGEWKIRFTDGGPKLPAPLTTTKLASWTELAGEDGKNFSGTAVYELNFARPAGYITEQWQLNLGQLSATAEVKLNGKSIGTLIGPVFQLVIPDQLIQGENKLEITVSSLMANRIAYMDRNAIPWKIFYNTNMPARKPENARKGLFYAGDWKPFSSGLLGPVTIAPYKLDN